MAVYREGNMENGNRFYPYESATTQIRLAEQDFADYLRNTFFHQEGAVYCVLEENGSYISAARIEKYEDGYLLTALETRPDCRRKGYGMQLINGLLARCKDNGWMPIYSHISNQNYASMRMHLQCGFRVLKDSARYLDGSVRSDSKTLKYEK